MTDNPYTTPTAKLEKPEALRRSILWKIYFYLFLIYLALGIFGLLITEESGLAEVLSCVFVIPALVGFFGYVWSKRIFSRSFWTVFFLAYIAWSILYYFVTDIDLYMGQGLIYLIITQIVSWAFALPAYIGLYLYQRKKYVLWTKP